MVEKWKSRPKKVRGIPTFPPSRRRLRLDYFLTPQTTLQFSTPLLTQTLQSRQGDTMWVGSTTRVPHLRKPLSSGIIMVCLYLAGLFRAKDTEVCVNDPTGALWRAQTTVLPSGGD